MMIPIVMPMKIPTVLPVLGPSPDAAIVGPGSKQGGGFGRVNWFPVEFAQIGGSLDSRVILACTAENA